MEKERMYVAPQAEILEAQVEKGVYSSTQAPSDGGDF